MNTDRNSISRGEPTDRVEAKSFDERRKSEPSVDALANRYEGFVDIVCTGARFGTSESLESRFVRSRNGLLPKLPEIATIIAQYHSGDQQRVAELLRSVLGSNTLTHLLHEDDGNLIPRLTWISQALFEASSGDCTPGPTAP